MGRGYHMDDLEAEAVAGNMQSLRERAEKAEAEVERLRGILYAIAYEDRDPKEMQDLAAQVFEEGDE